MPAVSSWYQSHYWLIFSHDLKKKTHGFLGTCFFSVETKVPPLVGEDLSELLGQLLPSEVDENPEGGKDWLKTVMDELSMIIYIVQDILRWLIEYILCHIYIHMIDIRLHSNNLYYRII